MSFNALRENKILAKNSEFTVNQLYEHLGQAIVQAKVIHFGSLARTFPVLLISCIEWLTRKCGHLSMCM